MTETKVRRKRTRHKRRTKRFRTAALAKKKKGTKRTSGHVPGNVDKPKTGRATDDDAKKERKQDTIDGKKSG